MCRLLLTGLLIILSPVGATDEWRSTDGSELTFEVDFQGKPIRGEFGEFEVVLNCDTSCPESATLRVTVKLEAADMGDPDMNEMLLGSAWLAAGEFPEALFVSDSVVEREPGRFAATGKLDLKGVVKPVVVPFSWERDADTATMRGTFVVQRSEFDIGSGEWATDKTIGIDVTLHFAVQLVTKD